MPTLKYKIIKTEEQYNRYCEALEQMVMSDSVDNYADEIELLTLLIDKYDEEQSEIPEGDPITLIKDLMDEHNLKQKDLVQILGCTKGYVSEILNYKKSLSKDVIRKLSSYFKVSQDFLNREYELKGDKKVVV
ncbi:MAG: helix-turn-helix domain-containing protein [Alkalimonas sp.]|nr:helix-turn-helix domain-containing protein [Alkalimonas sp.]